jgi:hypothetical protein
MRAYVLIQADVTADGGGLTDQLGRISGVHGADRVNGPYDVIVEVAAEPMGFSELVGRITALDGVLRALVSPVVDGSGEASEDAA